MNTIWTSFRKIFSKDVLAITKGIRIPFTLVFMFVVLIGYSATTLVNAQSTLTAYDSLVDDHDFLLSEYDTLREEYENLASEYSLMMSNKEFTPLVEEITSIVSPYGEAIGLSFYDINSGYSFSINGDKSFTAASTTKVPINMVLFDKMVYGELDEDAILYFTDDDYEGGAGILLNMDLSQPFSIMDLSEYSIVYSDNIATQMIKRYINDTYDLYDEFDNLLGYSANHKDNSVTPNDSATYLRILYENENKNPYYDLLIDAMKNTIFNYRMDRYIDNNLVAHKIGDYNGFTNDIGIVYANNPFILTVFTDNIESADELIGELTKLIFDFQNER